MCTFLHGSCGGESELKYATIKKIDVANGLGVRVSLFVSGCRRHCRGCFNPETWDFEYGTTFTQDTETEILDALRPPWIQGLSVLGGEPMEEENRNVLTPFLKRVSTTLPDKDVWLYTGYTLEEIRGDPILQYVDVLVDGSFIQELRDVGLSFRGSRNQRILYLKEMNV